MPNTTTEKAKFKKNLQWLLVDSKVDSSVSKLADKIWPLLDQQITASKLELIEQLEELAKTNLMLKDNDNPVALADLLVFQEVVDQLKQQITGGEDE